MSTVATWQSTCPHLKQQESRIEINFDSLEKKKILQGTYGQFCEHFKSANSALNEYNV